MAARPAAAESSSRVEDLRARGNQAWQKGNFPEAVRLYTEALELDPGSAKLYSNRSAAHMGLSQHEKALADADAAIQQDSQWSKAHFRKGCALEELGRLQEAVEAYQTAQQLEGTSASADVATRLRAVRAKLKQQKQAAEKAARQAQQKSHPGPAGLAGFAGMHVSSINQQGVRTGRAGAEMPGPNAWARGLTPAKQYEWLADCYRMRVDDDYVHGGGQLRGLYDMSSEDSNERRRWLVLEDFLIFCKMAAKNGALPPRWDWAAFLRTAAADLVFAFEKSDAQEKWGSENYFDAMMGGRSLRFTAEVVYGHRLQGPQEHTPEMQAVEAQVQGNWERLLADEASKAFFEDVGGVEVWRKLGSEMPHIPGTD